MAMLNNQMVYPLFKSLGNGKSPWIFSRIAGWCPHSCRLASVLHENPYIPVEFSTEQKLSHIKISEHA